MTKILFASTMGCNPILATNDDGVKEDCDQIGHDMDDLVPSADIMDLKVGIYIWEGERRESWFGDELDIHLIKSAVRPATEQDMNDLDFPASKRSSKD